MGTRSGHAEAHQETTVLFFPLKSQQVLHSGRYPVGWGCVVVFGREGNTER
jgi:hypothetical protein